MFHDGSRVEASDVFNSLQRLAKSRDYGWLLAGVEGTAPGRSAPSGLRLLGSQTIELRLTTARNLDLLVMALAAPQAGVVDSSHNAARGIGSGPFALKSRRGGSHTLRVNRDYFDGPPYLSEVQLLDPTSRDDHIRRLQLGRADGSLLGDSVYGEEPIKGVVLREGPPSDTSYLVFNPERGPTRQEEIRRAVHLALDRRRLAASAAQPVGFPGSAGPPRSNPTQAKALLAKVGNPTSGGRPLILIVEEDDAFGVSLAPLIERDLTTAGLAIDLVKASSTELRSRLASGAWDMRLQSLSPVSPSPVLQLAQALALGGMQAEAFRLVGQAPASPQAEISRSLTALERQLPLVPLCQRSPRLHHRVTLRGVLFDETGLLRLADLWVLPSSPRGGP
jgi:ABC-type transport system substrate-binding protein